MQETRVRRFTNAALVVVNIVLLIMVWLQGRAIESANVQLASANRQLAEAEQALQNYRDAFIEIRNTRQSLAAMKQTLERLEGKSH